MNSQLWSIEAVSINNSDRVGSRYITSFLEQPNSPHGWEGIVMCNKLPYRITDQDLQFRKLQLFDHQQSHKHRYTSVERQLNR